MRRVVAIGLAGSLVSLAIGGCPSPSTQQSDPQPGVVSVLAAGSYSGPLACGTVDDQGVQSNTQSVTGQVLVTADGGLRLYADNIAPGVTLTNSQPGISAEETIGQITETTDTVTIPTTGSITVATARLDTSRTVTLKQLDPKTIQMTDSTKNTGEATGKSVTNTCTGTITSN